MGFNCLFVDDYCEEVETEEEDESCGQLLKELKAREGAMLRTRFLVKARV